MTSSPSATGSTASVFVIARSALVVRASTSVAESFAGFGSTMGDDEIVAVLDSKGSAYAAGIAIVSWYETEPPDTKGADVVHVNMPAAMTQSASTSEPFVPTGIASVTTTPAGSVDGPSFVSVMEYVVDVPATTEATPSVLAIRRSAAGVTVVVSMSELFARAGSDVVADTVAVSVISPSIVVVTTIVTVAVAPNGTTPSGQVTTPAACEQLPWLGVADTNVTDPGSVSVTTTPVASEGPRFVTVMSYVTSSPADTGSTRSVFAMARSADDVTVSMSVAESSEGSVSTIGSNVMVAVFANVAAT